MSPPTSFDPDAEPPEILVIGAGAAGMMAALAARGALDHTGASTKCAPDAPVVTIFNNEERIGLKILVSGGGRCNVANSRPRSARSDTSGS